MLPSVKALCTFALKVICAHRKYYPRKLEMTVFIPNAYYQHMLDTLGVVEFKTQVDAYWATNANHCDVKFIQFDFDAQGNLIMVVTFSGEAVALVWTIGCANEFVMACVQAFLDVTGPENKKLLVQVPRKEFMSTTTTPAVDFKLEKVLATLCEKHPAIPDLMVGLTRDMIVIQGTIV